MLPLDGHLSLSLTVNDVERSLRFYTEALGFTVTERYERAGTIDGAIVRAGHVEIGLTQDDFAQGRERLKGVGLSIHIDTAQDVTTLAARAVAAGAVLRRGLAQFPWGPSGFSLADPDGFTIFVSSRSSG